MDYNEISVVNSTHLPQVPPSSANGDAFGQKMYLAVQQATKQQLQALHAWIPFLEALSNVKKDGIWKLCTMIPGFAEFNRNSFRMTILGWETAPTKNSTSICILYGAIMFLQSENMLGEVPTKEALKRKHEEQGDSPRGTPPTSPPSSSSQEAPLNPVVLSGGAPPNLLTSNQPTTHAPAHLEQFSAVQQPPPNLLTSNQPSAASLAPSVRNIVHSEPMMHPSENRTSSSPTSRPSPQVHVITSTIGDPRMGENAKYNQFPYNQRSFISQVNPRNPPMQSQSLPTNNGYQFRPSQSSLYAPRVQRPPEPNRPFSSQSPLQGHDSPRLSPQHPMAAQSMYVSRPQPTRTPPPPSVQQNQQMRARVLQPPKLQHPQSLPQHPQSLSPHSPSLAQHSQLAHVLSSQPNSQHSPQREQLQQHSQQSLPFPQQQNFSQMSPKPSQTPFPSSQPQQPQPSQLFGQQQTPPRHLIECANCKQWLRYPLGAEIIRCPKCNGATTVSSAVSTKTKPPQIPGPPSSWPSAPSIPPSSNAPTASKYEPWNMVLSPTKPNGTTSGMIPMQTAASSTPTSLRKDSPAAESKSWINFGSQIATPALSDSKLVVEDGRIGPPPLVSNNELDLDHVIKMKSKPSSVTTAYEPPQIAVVNGPPSAFKAPHKDVLEILDEDESKNDVSKQDSQSSSHESEKESVSPLNAGEVIPSKVEEHVEEAKEQKERDSNSEDSESSSSRKRESTSESEAPAAKKANTRS